MAIKSFTDLIVWKEGHKLVLFTYQTTNKIPKEEQYVLIPQIRRCAISVISNIAEGFGRKTYKEKLQFYYQAQGSLIELKNQMLISRDLGYLDKNTFSKLAKQANTTHKLLQGLITKTKTFINPKS